MPGWMASPTRWTWVWVNSGSPGVLRFMGLQRVGHDLSDWTELNSYPAPFWASLPLCFTFLPSYCVVLMDSHTHFCSAVFCQALFPHTSHQLLFLFSIYNFSFFLLLKPFFPPKFHQFYFFKAHGIFCFFSLGLMVLTWCEQLRFSLSLKTHFTFISIFVFLFVIPNMHMSDHFTLKSN